MAEISVVHDKATAVVKDKMASRPSKTHTTSTVSSASPPLRRPPSQNCADDATQVHDAHGKGVGLDPNIASLQCTLAATLGRVTDDTKGINVNTSISAHMDLDIMPSLGSRFLGTGGSPAPRPSEAFRPDGPADVPRGILVDPNPRAAKTREEWVRIIV